MGRDDVDRTTRVLALDPGATVGWASSNSNGLDSGEIAMDAIRAFCSEADPEVVVIEWFSGPSRRKFFDLAGAESLAVARDWAFERGIEPIFQMPSQAKHYFTDKRLRERELYRAGQPHANDAMRHLLYYLKAFS